MYTITAGTDGVVFACMDCPFSRLLLRGMTSGRQRRHQREMDKRMSAWRERKCHRELIDPGWSGKSETIHKRASRRSPRSRLLARNNFRIARDLDTIHNVLPVSATPLGRTKGNGTMITFVMCSAPGSKREN
jgi:hypothetical protein